MKQLEKFNQNYKVQVHIPIQWGDMDAFNHVNNVMYFKYFESVRIAYFERVGIMKSHSDTTGAPILAETTCRYKLPLNFPDSILVGTKVIENHSHGFLMEYAIYSNKLKKITTIGTGRIVLLNYKTHEKIKVNSSLLKKIEELQK